MNSAKSRDNSLSKQVLQRDLGICQCCGYLQDGDQEVHHILPVHRGGEAVLENLITLCGTCHKYAPNDPDTFLVYQRSGGAVWQLKSGWMVADAVLNQDCNDITLQEFWELLCALRVKVYSASYELAKTRTA